MSVPTTYSGAEWTPSFGVRSPDRRIVGGGGGANLAAIVYDVGLTLDLPRAETVGTALNALAHCAEALYVQGRNDAGDAAALAGAELIAGSLPRVVAEPHDVEARDRAAARRRQRGRGARARRSRPRRTRWPRRSAARFGLPHGAMNALALPPALRFNAQLAPDAVARFGAAIGAPDDPAAKVEELARLGGFERLRDFGVPEDGLAERRRGRGEARRQQEQPAPGHPGRDRAAAARDLLTPRDERQHGHAQLLRRVAVGEVRGERHAGSSATAFFGSDGVHDTTSNPAPSTSRR